jgi:hypothetical protein
MFRAAVIIFALASAAAITPLGAQQSFDSLLPPSQGSVRADAPPAASPQTVSPSVGATTTRPLGPWLSPQFQSVQPRLAPAPGFENQSLMAARGQTTITISTLTLVLIVIVIVLLVK